MAGNTEHISNVVSCSGSIMLWKCYSLTQTEKTTTDGNMAVANNREILEQNLSEAAKDLRLGQSRLAAGQGDSVGTTMKILLENLYSYVRIMQFFCGGLKIYVLLSEFQIFGNMSSCN